MSPYYSPNSQIHRWLPSMDPRVITNQNNNDQDDAQDINTIKMQYDQLLAEKHDHEKRYLDKVNTLRERIYYLSDNDHDDVVQAIINDYEGQYKSTHSYRNAIDMVDLRLKYDRLAMCVERDKSFYENNLNKLYDRLGKFAKLLTCAICLELIPRDRFMSCGCKHKNCDLCLTNQFTTIITEGTVDNIRCPSTGCPTMAPQVLIERLVRPEIYQRYEILTLKQAINNAVNDFTDVCYCPMERCTWIVEVDPCKAGATCGKCRYQFCTRCQKPYHGDCDYSDAREHEKRQHYQQSVLTITNTTKKCPTCQSPIEKNGGCNHMTCKCGARFNWA